MIVGVCAHHSCSREALDGEKWCWDHHPDKGDSNLFESGPKL